MLVVNTEAEFLKKASAGIPVQRKVVEVTTQQWYRAMARVTRAIETNQALSFTYMNFEDYEALCNARGEII